MSSCRLASTVSARLLPMNSEAVLLRGSELADTALAGTLVCGLLEIMLHSYAV